MSVPSAEDAIEIAVKVTGRSPTRAQRFTTGARHFVFEVEFEDRLPVVVRMGDQTAHAEMIGAVHLSRLLKPRGLRLPALLANDVTAEFPWLVLERLPGTDLCAIISQLSDDQLVEIAARVAGSQTTVAETGSAGRYGYAALPERAPFKAWSQVVQANLDRSRQRIAAAGLFDVALAEGFQSVLEASRHQLDQMEPTLFLHDTTTKNVIITSNGSFAGIVDVDGLCFGDPRYPVSLTLAVLLAYGGPAQYVSAWMRQARHADNRTFRLYVSLYLLDLMGEHGRPLPEKQPHPAARTAERSGIPVMRH
jgi:aminoglycoside phosphotransferase